MPSFSIPLSGLNSDSVALDTIANNLANMNTTGFKSQKTTFGDLFYQQLGQNGAGNVIQVGTGVKVASNRIDFTSGSISTTGVAGDAAISGEGFFVLDNNGQQLYTRNGTFSTTASGVLQSSTGLNVMGYPAVNGVINTNGSVGNIVLPVGQTMQPSATTTFSLTENLDSRTTIGKTVTGQIEVYDSLGNTYTANITYTNLGNNQWTYQVKLPDTLTPISSSSATISNALTQDSTASATGSKTLSYNFGSSGGVLGTVNAATNLTITGPTAAGGTATIIAPTVTAGESLTAYAAALNTALTAAGITGVTVTSNASGQLAITGPSSTLSTAGTVQQDLNGKTATYQFGNNNGSLATVDTGTNLSITGPTAGGGTATVLAPSITDGESVAAYVAALNSAINASGIVGVTVSGPTANGQVTVTCLSSTGSVIQDAVPSATAAGKLVFDTSGNLSAPSADIAGITFGGLSDNAATINMTWNLYSASGKSYISQTASSSSTSSKTQNGYASGDYSGFTIGSDGTVTAAYSNSQKLAVAQLAMATIANTQGLVSTGSTEYETTAASGMATIGVANTGGRGTIQSASLEGSNVNISSEFSNLIIAQRAFEANAKSVTTFDTVTQQAINLIRS